MEKITIAKALKEKKRLIEKSERLFNLIISDNVKCLMVGKNDPIPTVEDFNKLRCFDTSNIFTTYTILLDKIIKIKTAIAIANVPIIEKIIRLETRKAQLRTLDTVRIEQSNVQQVDNDTKQITNVFFDKNSIISTKELLQQEINNLQDELDEFNAKTYIEVDLIQDFLS